MQLTGYTDYALRVLIYISRKAGEQATIHEIAEYFHISENHLIKVVHQLGRNGFLKTTRGKGGGLALARPAEDITLGSVVRTTETHFNWVECFNKEQQDCRLLPACRLKPVLAKAGEAYLRVLDGTTLSDIAGLSK